MMSEDMLSQDEIDALLRGSDDEQVESGLTESNFLVEDYLSSMEQDALGEIGNISFGSSATALSTLLNQKVDITTPTVSVIERSRIQEEFPHPYVAIQVSYTEGFSGMNLLVIKQTDAAIIADLMLGGDGVNPSELLGEIQLSAVQEAMNQMMGSAATSMSTIFSKRVDISPPSIDLLDLLKGDGVSSIPNEDMLVKISFRLKIGNLIDSNIMQLLPLPFAKSLVDELLNPKETSANVEKIEQVVPTPTASIKETVPYEESFNHQPTMHNSYNNQYNNQPTSGNYESMNHQMNQPSHPNHFGATGHVEGVQSTVQPAVFSNFTNSPHPQGEPNNLNLLLDIPLQVTVELGRTKRSVREILDLSPGSIIELDKLAGEPVDILINNRLIAQGEVVVIDENFGVRVTDIISQSDRIKKLR